MNIIKGNILNCEENILVHQVNHQGVMGAGLALQIKKAFPFAFDRYLDVCKTLSWNVIQEAGAVDFVGCKSANNSEFYIANMFGQRFYGNLHEKADYGAMETGLKTIFRFSFRNKFSVAIPYAIGCGLGKGDWGIVSKMIEDIFENKVEYKVYKLIN